jgi:type I restriction enzyme, R subunit
LSQIIPYQDSDLERLYVFLRHLSAKLPRRKGGPAYQFDDDVRLEYYRLQKISEGSISLLDGKGRALDGPTEVGSGLAREEKVPLSQLIDIVNQRFGTDFNQADQLFFDQIVEAALTDDGLRQAAAVNPEDKFELVFRSMLERLFVERMDQNEEIFVRYMNDPSFRQVVTNWMASEAYRKLRLGPGAVEPSRPQVVSLKPSIIDPKPEDRYQTCLPFVPLKAAAGAFSNPQHIEDAGFEWVAIESRHRLRPGMFVAQVVGRSMEPTIPDGAYCIFRAPVEGTRQGKTVLVQMRDAMDPETVQEGDSWRHARIILKPVNPDFEPIVLTGAEEGELQVIAEFVEVLFHESLQPDNPTEKAANGHFGLDR